MKNFTRFLGCCFLNFIFMSGILAQPANDDCTSAVPVGALPWTSSGYDVTLATTTGDPTAPSCQTSVARSIWFTFTPASTGNYYLSTCQSDAPASTLPDIVLGIYTSAGGCAGAFTQVTCDDDNCTTLANQAIVTATTLTAGTTYYIVAWQYCLACSAPSAGSETIQLYVKQNTVPDCATLNTPANGATGIAANTALTWTAPVSGGTPTGYKVYLGTSNPPSLVTTVTAPTTTYTPSGQLPSTLYYWYIVPTNGVGDAVGCNGTIFSYTTAGGPTCPGSLGAGTVTIGSLPYSATGLATCGNGNNITSSNATVCGSSNYYGAEDKTFVFTPTSTATYSIDLTTITDDDAGIMLYNGCPFSGGGTCVGNAQSTSGLTRNISAMLTGGVTYYLVVDNWPSPSCISNFNLSIQELLAPSCTNNLTPANGATGISLTPTITWTAAPLATSYDIYFVGTLPTGWVNPVNTTSTSYTILAGNTLANNTTYTWYVVPKNVIGSATGCSSNTTTFTTVAGPSTFSGTGNWSDPARWSAGVPNCTVPVTIASGAICTIDVAATASNVTVTGTLNIPGNSLTLGCTIGGGNRSLGVTGTLNISGGTLTVNGYVSINAGATFSQTGGDFIIDGNDGTAGGSVTSSNYLLSFSNSGSANTLSGGNLIFPDPHFASQYTLYWNCTVAHTNASGSHTTFFGDGMSSSSGGSSNGFYINTWVGTYGIAFNNLVINGPSASNRHFTSIYSFGILKDLTVNSGAEFRPNISTYVAGNIINDGTYTNTSTLLLAAYPNRTAAATGLTQTISGAGIYRNATSGVTANMVSLTINNTSGTPVTFPANMTTGQGTGSVSSTLTLTSGKINNLSPLTLGISTSTPGTLTGGSASSYIIGEFRRWNSTATGTTSRIFQIGSTISYQPVTINFTAAQTTGGVISALFTSGTPGTTGLPLLDGGITNTSVSPTGYWTVERISGSGGTYTADANASGFTKTDGVSPITLFSEIRLLKRPTGGSWTSADGTPVAPAGLTSVTRPGCTSFSQFAIGGTDLALPLELKSFTGQTLDLTNMLYWTTASEKNMQWHIIERSVNGFDHWIEVGKKASYGDAQIDQSYSLEDRAPLTKGFYRLRSVEVDGRQQVSGIIALVRKNDHTGIVSVFPNPATDVLNVLFGSSEEETVTVLITDFSGRLVKQQLVNVQKGENAISVELSQLSAGTYTINISNSNTVAEPLRFVKQ